MDNYTNWYIATSMHSGFFEVFAIACNGWSGLLRSYVNEERSIVIAHSS